jgi:hypothetical protein
MDNAKLTLLKYEPSMSKTVYSYFLEVIKNRFNSYNVIVTSFTYFTESFPQKIERTSCQTIIYLP